MTAAKFITAAVIEAGFHTPPNRLLAIWLDGEVEFETSDGEVRRVLGGNAFSLKILTARGIFHAIRPKGKT